MNLLPASLAFSLCLVLAGGCVAPQPEPPQSAAAASVPEDLPLPFTAEQIRDEWVPGLTLTLVRRTPAEEVVEHWTVVAADAEGATIEYLIPGNGDTSDDEPRVERSSWTELRDHAAFKASEASRERVRRETPLGTYDGWLYTVRKPRDGTVAEFFFADALPGAPVSFRVVQGEFTVMALEQRERRRPAAT